MTYHKSAVTTLLERDQAQRDARAFELQIEAFWKQWAPEDKYEAARFHAELHMLVRQIYQEAQAPLLKQWGEALSLLTIPPLVKVDNG